MYIQLLHCSIKVYVFCTCTFLRKCSNFLNFNFWRSSFPKQAAIRQHYKSYCDYCSFIKFKRLIFHCLNTDVRKLFIGGFRSIFFKSWNQIFLLKYVQSLFIGCLPLIIFSALSDEKMTRTCLRRQFNFFFFYNSFFFF